MADGRNWREAKPKWVVEAATKEMKQLELVAALRWPTVARPEPLPFSWGDYDKLKGQPTEGAYWNLRGERIALVHIRKNPEGNTYCHAWQFSSDGQKWTDHVQRGSFFLTEKDALTELLWSRCEEAAGNILRVRSMIKALGGEA